MNKIIILFLGFFSISAVFGKGSMFENGPTFTNHDQIKSKMHQRLKNNDPMLMSEILDFFTKILTKADKSIQLSNEDESVVFDALRTLGHFAKVNKRAQEFLIAHLDQDVWKYRCKWKSNRGNYLFDLLVSYSIQGLGTANLSTTLNSFYLKSPRYLFDFAGDVVQGKFNIYLAQTVSKSVYIRWTMGKFINPIDAENSKVAFLKWTKNPVGKKLLTWANEAMKGSRPDK